MKLQLRKMQGGSSLVVTDENGEMLPSQITVQIVADKVIVEFGLWGDDISLSDKPAAEMPKPLSDWTKTGRDQEHS